MEDFWPHGLLHTTSQIAHTLPALLTHTQLAHQPRWQVGLRKTPSHMGCCTHITLHPPPIHLPSSSHSLKPPCDPWQVDLWKTSGHMDFYRESMFDQMEVEEEEYQVGHRGPE